MCIHALHDACIPSTTTVDKEDYFVGTPYYSIYLRTYTKKLVESSEKEKAGENLYTLY